MGVSLADYKEKKRARETAHLPPEPEPYVGPSYAPPEPTEGWIVLADHSKGGVSLLDMPYKVYTDPQEALDAANALDDQEGTHGVIVSVLVPYTGAWAG